MNQSNTAEDLKKEFNKRFVNLTAITARYFGYSERVTKEKAATGFFEFKIFKVNDSQKCPWIVDVYDFAKYLDERRGNS